MVTYSESVTVALVIQHVMRMRPIILSSVACLALQYFSHYLIKGTIFLKTNTECKMSVLIFSTIFVWNMSHYEKNSARYHKKCISTLMLRTRYSCLMLMKLDFFRQIFEIYSNIKCHNKPSSGSRIVPCGRTDGWPEEAKSRFSQFCEGA